MQTLLGATASLVVGALLLAPAGAHAQSFQGGVRGSVKDSQGVIPGASVTLTNDATAVSRDTASNASGGYSFPAVDPGVYTVKATVPGFKTFERRGIRIGTQQFLTLDVVMEVGAIEETITVTASAPLIETSNASTGEVLDQRAIEALPQVGRNVFTLATTAPTVQSSGASYMVRMQDQTNASALSLGGGGVRSNNYLLDGYPVTDLQNRSTTNPSAETIEDVRVQVHTYDAEMGRTGGGVLNTTGKSGTNAWRGSAFAQIRPNALISDNFFLRIQNIENAAQYWRSFGGSFGGPVMRGKTFFWFATEGYRDGSTLNAQQTVPTTAMRNGDFSGLRDATGQPITIYDPLTTDANGNRQPFAGNVIPANRINAVGRNIVSAFPQPDREVNQTGNRAAQGISESQAQQWSLKLDHNFSDRITLSGIYLHQGTSEPDAVMWPDAPYAYVGYQIDRSIHVGVLNNTYILNDSTVATLRLGVNRFSDDNVMPFDFDSHQLGWNAAFADGITPQKFPSIAYTGYTGMGYFGAANRDYYSYGVNGSVTRLAGAHSFKFGGDYRILGVKGETFNQSAGVYNFTGRFTGANANAQGTSSGNAIADLLLGYPATGTLTLYTPIDNYVNYYGAYLQDDWRVNNRLTLNYGLRLEHETGLREANDRLIVGFDTAAVSPLNVSIPASVDPLTGAARQVTGGLRYGGVDGQPIEPGNQPALKLSPRVGAAYTLNETTVVRGGYGLFWAPWNYALTSPTGFSSITSLQQPTNIPTTSMSNPFGSGLIQPSGNNLGLASGVSSDVSFVDPTRTAPRVHQYSVDLQRQLPGDMSVTVGYIGASGRNLAWGGTQPTAVNINQLDPKYQALGPVLNELVPNPFFGNPAAGSFASRQTIERGQLLRPFPQFGAVNMTESTLARSQYHAGIFSLRKRMSHGWAGSANYTYSRLSDNQFGQNNFFSAAPGIQNHYTAIPGSPYYDPDAEYGRSLLDSPHKFSFTPIVQVPFGAGRRWLNGGGVTDWIVGGWSLSSIITVQSGFPIGVTQTAPTTNYGAGQRPNIVPGVDFRLPGSITERLQQNPADNRYLNPAAFGAAPAFTYGNAPRILPGVYSPWRNQTDLGINKEFPVGGTRRAVLQMQVINVFNNPWYSGFASTNVQALNFGTVAQQANSPRLWQVLFRYAF